MTAPCGTRFWWGRGVCVSLLMLPKQFGFQGNGVKVRRLLPALRSEKRVSAAARAPPLQPSQLPRAWGGGHPGLPACCWGGAGWQSAWPGQWAGGALGRRGGTEAPHP